MQISSPAFNWAANRLIDPERLKTQIPDFERFIEPFFGGGQLYFNLLPQTPSLLNDINPFIISFYRELQNEKSPLKKEVDTLLEEWKIVERFYDFVQHDIEMVVSDMRQQIITIQDAPYVLRTIFSLNMQQPEFESLFSLKNVVDSDNLIETFVAACISHLKRIHCKSFTPMSPIILKNGFFNHLRYLNNNWPKYKKVANNKRLAIWYFVNLLSDTARINYSEIEKVTLPFPKKAPSTKEIELEIHRVFGADFKMSLENALLHCSDYAEFLNNIDISDNDFVYIDPPFNAKYLHYEHSAFTEKDHVHLAEIVGRLKSRWMLIIKETDFKPELYSNCKTRVSKAPMMSGKENGFLVVVNY
jgi:DNA adenine methylase